MIKQYTNRDFEIFTIDNLYTSDEIDNFINYIETHEGCPFTNSSFKNGKIIEPKISKLMFSRIKSYLPSIYLDHSNTKYSYLKSPIQIMYSKISKGEQFCIHTDTGCIYSHIDNQYSKYTVLTYLNDNYEGGNTQFYTNIFNKTVTIQPKKNRTLIFDIDLFHSGEIVTKGEKYWIGTELVCKKIK
jgi:hypothetical protein